ncbi:hypothetical protein [Nannocystis punicea]|uniref:Uncharacterized protein n=1 Tax=Nannocystis punicea TaxID=2995304 RepID=A0ABY7GXI4_9BACT|nr:hypothetical protein [Nannocystis poenicansa]WAS91694.1 hypothetical protein O0S08_36395 [Nannocystis poenicansa]
MPSKPPRRRCALALGLGLGLAACNEPASGGAACLPPGRPVEEAIEIPIDKAPDAPASASSLWWFCEDPPPEVLLDGRYKTELVWVDGEECDPCDLERIASYATPQVCDSRGPIRLLCGPIPQQQQPNPWDRKGCVYAVATSSGCSF